MLVEHVVITIINENDDNCVMKSQYSANFSEMIDHDTSFRFIWIRQTTICLNNLFIWTYEIHTHSS